MFKQQRRRRRRIQARSKSPLSPLLRLSVHLVYGLNWSQLPALCIINLSNETLVLIIRVFVNKIIFLWCLLNPVWGLCLLISFLREEEAGSIRLIYTCYQQFICLTLKTYFVFLSPKLKLWWMPNHCDYSLHTKISAHIAFWALLNLTRFVGNNIKIYICINRFIMKIYDAISLMRLFDLLKCEMSTYFETEGYSFFYFDE